jgi:hypothetical protein
VNPSEQGRRNRRRGADAERRVVRFLVELGFEARRHLAGDGKQPGDIDWLPGVVIEVKDVAGSSWPSWRHQAVEQADWRIPVVVRRIRGVADVGRWDAQMPWRDWLDNGGDDERGVCICRRTDRPWAVVTFGEVVEVLREEL